MRICAAMLFCLSLLGQTRPVAQPETGLANLPAQTIGPYDLLVVYTYDAPEFCRTVRVDDAGFIQIPMLRRPLQAAGRMPSEIGREIAQALTSEGLIVDPVVTVTVAEYHSRPISVAGAVKAPLTFQANGPLTLLEALTRAGGLSPEAGSEVLVSRGRAAGEGGALTRRIPIKGLIADADPELNLRLTGGEEIRVPEAGKVFVVGNVKHPGAFAVQENGETTVLRVLALAEGLAPFSGTHAYIYRREGGTGSKNEIPIELHKIMERKSPDVPLMASDVLYVPDNNGHRIGVAALEKVLMFGSTAGATALIYGR